MFVITDARHRDCDACRDQAQQAVTMAMCTGSVGATNGIGGAATEHWATVRRVVDPEADMLELRHPTGHYDNDPLHVPANDGCPNPKCHLADADHDGPCIEDLDT